MVKKKTVRKKVAQGRPKGKPKALTASQLSNPINSQCHVCRHEAVGTMNKMLIDDCASTEIAKKFGMSADSVQRHRVNHLSSALRVAEQQRQKQLSLEVQTFDDRTYLASIDKLKLMQQNILNDLECKLPQEQRTTLYASWLKYLHLEAKLLNLFDLPPTDNIHQINVRCATLTKNHLNKLHPQSTNPNPTRSWGSEETQQIADQITSAFNFIYGVDVASPMEVVRILLNPSRESPQT